MLNDHTRAKQKFNVASVKEEQQQQFSLVRGSGLLLFNYLCFFVPNTHCALVVALSEKNKYHSYGYRKSGIIILQHVFSISTSVFPNTRAWEQQE